MTTGQIVLAVVLNLVASIIFIILFQPFLAGVGEWLRGRVKSLPATREALRYYKVARRDIAYDRLITKATSTVLGWSALHYSGSFGNRYAAGLLFGLVMAGTVVFMAEIVSIRDIRELVDRYDWHKARTRPHVSETEMIKVDAEFASIESRSDYDGLISKLRRLRQRSWATASEAMTKEESVVHIDE